MVATNNFIGLNGVSNCLDEMYADLLSFKLLIHGPRDFYHELSLAVAHF